MVKIWLGLKTKISLKDSFQSESTVTCSPFSLYSGPVIGVVGMFWDHDGMRYITDTVLEDNVTVSQLNWCKISLWKRQMTENVRISTAFK